MSGYQDLGHDHGPCPGPCPGQGFHTSRRTFLRSGLGALFGSLLARPRSGWAGSSPARPRSLILLYMAGGPSHLDTFDPKPGTREGGPFRAIPTRIPEAMFSEHLPRLAERADRLAVLRTLHSREGSHERARYLVHTAYAPVPGTRHASLGASISHETGPSGSVLPHYVTLGGPGEGAGFFGPAHAPFVVRSNPGDPVENLQPWKDLDRRRLDGRLELVRAFDAGFARHGAAPQTGEHETMLTRGRALMDSVLPAAFTLEAEPRRIRDAYGESAFGRRCHIARRLVEVGVRCVEVELAGWDTHEDNFTRHQELLGQLDPAMSGLLDDLAERALLETTVVLWIGEFGRTPRINPREGRDHHPHGFSAVLAGGGIRAGRVVGGTTATGDRVADRPIGIPDLFATLFRLLMIDGDKDYLAGDRPITLANKGRPIAEIL